MSAEISGSHGAMSLTAWRMMELERVPKKDKGASERGSGQSAGAEPRLRSLHSHHS